MTGNDVGEQLVRIETKLSYLEDFLAKLQSIAVEHTEAIDRLKSENKALRAKLGEIDDAVQYIPNVRPPHY